MCTKFFSAIIEKEKKLFDVHDEALKTSARLLLQYQKNKNSGENISPLDYNVPEIRCAYLYRYSTINAGIAKKYFRKIVRKNEVKSTLRTKENINICSLGGGPGTDVFGIVDALQVVEKFHTKVVKATVLDICEGWENSFALINNGCYRRELIKVDLSDSLPVHVQEIISSADIVSIVRFISAIEGDKRCEESLKVIGSLIKTGAVILYIDSLNEQICSQIEDTFKEVGFETVLGPLHERYLDWANIQANNNNKSKSELYKELFGCFPQYSAKFSVLGCIKTDGSSKSISIFSGKCSVGNICEDSDAETKDLNSCLEVLDSNLENNESENDIGYSAFDKYTQTETEVFTNSPVNNEATASQIEELAALMTALSDLSKVIERKKKKERMNLYSYCCNMCDPV